MNLILGSQSPRRKEILSQLKIEFKIITADVDETLNPFLEIDAAIMEIALKKAKAVAEVVDQNSFIITADTMVILDGQPLGKPKNKIEAEHFLLRLAGRMYEVKTAVCVFNVKNKRIQTEIETSYVTFRKLKANEIRSYINTCNPLDKAGAYGIQDEEHNFISHLAGNKDNVMGLPIGLVRKMLRKEKFRLLA